MVNSATHLNPFVVQYLFISIIISRVHVEGKSSVYVMCLTLIIIIIIIGLVQILLAPISKHITHGSNHYTLQTQEFLNQMFKANI